MSDSLEGYSDIYLTPHGSLLLDRTAEPGPWPDLDVAARTTTALTRGAGSALLHLATRELNSSLPAAAAWLRELGRGYLTRMCHVPGLDQTRDLPPLPPPPDEEVTALLSAAPPFRGGEYLQPALLQTLWAELDATVRKEIASHPQGAGAWLRESHPLWRTVGRVTFHLAENKKSPTHPFAFLATYVSRISSQSRAQHLPLGQALKEYAGAKNKQALLNLLAPVQKAAEKSPFVKELVDSGRIFHPIPWTPREAYRCLQSAPACEEAGVLFRLPDWWKGGRPPRPKVRVRIGQTHGAGVGADALLDFTAAVHLEGDELSPEELQTLHQATDGLAFVRGKWVEVDPAKLDEALKHWKRVEKLAGRGGLNFYEGMRLLSGFHAEAAQGNESCAEEVAREWSGLEAGTWLEQVLSELRNPTKEAECKAIPGLQAQLRPYQETGVNWLWFLSRLGLGGCLADDMGLGKTLQVLAMLLKRKSEQPNSPRASLLVVPASLLANWSAEIQRFTPAIRFQILHPSEVEDLASATETLDAAPVDLAITTYGMLARTTELRTREWDLAILDEAQAIKNPETRQTRAVKELKTKGRFALTGTPVENRVGDLWSIFDFLNPGLLGSSSAFKQFLKAREAAERPDFSPLRNLTRPYILRRLKTDKRVIADLPDKTEVRAWCTLSRVQTALYQKAVTELAEGLKETDGIKRKGLILSFIMRFKQICNHPSQWLGDGSYAPEASGKFSRLRELTEEIAERQEKVLVFTQFREIAEPLSGFLSGVFGRPGLVLHGGTAVSERRRLVENFQRDDGPPFFILTVKAGGAGLNLTQAAHVIHFDRWWNPAVENQATDRAFRIGQTRNVLVHKFVCSGTVEERIDRVIEDKKSLSAELLGSGERLVTEMTNAELVQFVSLDLQRATAA